MQKNNLELLDLDKVLKNKAPRIYKKIPKFLLSWLKRKIHQDELNEILTIYADKDGVDFMEAVVGYFNLALDIRGLDELDKSGRYIFASNHPLGGLDGICLSAVIGEKFDKKIRYPVNDLLLNIPNLRSIFVPINKFGSQSKNAASDINEAFASENQIITFPAGLCSRKIEGKICDLEWKKMFVQKAVETRRDVIPVYFEAANSKFFYRFANIRKKLGVKFNIELIFLPDEMFKCKGSTFTITFGKPIKWEVFDKSKTLAQWAEYVKNEAYLLKG
ncbi:glycerol acyltransferase [Dysgonomonas sp. 216]|uniref:1-acyl-sn-glycerol-3-phosphate acyltransferase n=1 Tax=Dysgonomonas sp. 216 TaxID=2302934 RepID=UPI0013D6E183|nr:1-acyl-sn-glycerol-3-phosphate acyltransferase [Dysgonomonas sp. 216]NDW18153.1 glycerol acyltransferase [Dysgonomonas sp. 216]